MSLRRVTDEQFSDGTTIDAGSRLDAAIEDLTEHVGSIPIGDLRAHLVPNVYCCGCMPLRLLPNDTNTIGTPGYGIALDQRLPFTQNDNVIAGVANEQDSRTKGAEALGAWGSSDVDVVWTTAFYFKRPAIVTDIDLFSVIDANETNPPYPAAPWNARDWYADHTKLCNPHLCLLIDNEFARDTRKYDVVGLHRWEQHSGPLVSSLPADTGYTGMLPAYPLGWWGGALYEATGVFIPVHRDSRVRVRLAMYDDGKFHVRGAIWGMNLHVLEEVIS